MAGIYIHIPFCRKACHYCNFHFSTTLHSVDAMVNAIVQEAQMRIGYINEPIATIYFGGGTPSLLSEVHLQHILQTLSQQYNILPGAEVTLESNPDDITAEKLASWKQAGINRLSIGVQSFIQEDLQWMNRAHTAAQAIRCITLAQEEGFNNITIDLIYGTPTLTDKSWEENISKALALQVPHMSCYALTVEPKTALHKKIERHELPDVDAAHQARQFDILMRRLDDAGFEHYEISNFAKPGMRSRHNSSYWTGATYLGLGPSAHSFDGKSRQWNIANNALYIRSMEQGILPYEQEILTPTQCLNEYIMTSLRTLEGLSLDHVQANWGKGKAATITAVAQAFINRQHLQYCNNTLVLTQQGRHFADGIAGALFFDA